MSGKDDLEFRVVATDDASKVIDSVQKKADKLEGSEANVSLDAKDEASDRIDEVIKRTSQLDGETAEIILKAEASKAEGEIKKLSRALADLDGDEALAVVEAKDNASARLAKIKTALDEIDKADVDVEVGGLDKMSGLLDKLPGKAGELASNLGSLGKGGAIAAGVGGIATLLIEAGQSAADAAIEAQTLGKYIGTSTEEASRLLAVLGTVGIESGDLKDIIGQVNGVLTDTPELAKQLGIELKGASPAQVFIDAYNAISKIEDPQRRLILMGKAFGEEGARQIGALVARYGDLESAMRDVSDEQVLTDEDAAKAREYEKAMQKLTAKFQGLALTVGQNVLPVLTKAVELLTIVSELGEGIAPTRDLSLDQWVSTFKDANKTFEETQTQLVEMGFEWGLVTQALIAGGFAHDEATTKSRELSAQTAETERETRRLKDTTDDGTKAAEDFADAQHQAKLKTDIARTAIDLQRIAIDNLKGELSDEQALLNFQESMIGAQERIKENGKLTKQEIIDVKLAIIDAGETAGLTDVEIKSAIEKITPTDVNTAYITAQNLINAHADLTMQAKIQATIDAVVKTHSGAKFGLGPDGVLRPIGSSASSTPAPAPAATTSAPTVGATAATASAEVVFSPSSRLVSSPSVVNQTTIVNVPRGYRALDAATAAHRVERRSGRNYKGRGA